jgi:lantibiotic leader peptide-processing serine protease
MKKIVSTILLASVFFGSSYDVFAEEKEKVVLVEDLQELESVQKQLQGQHGIQQLDIIEEIGALRFKGDSQNLDYRINTLVDEAIQYGELLSVKGEQATPTLTDTQFEKFNWGLNRISKSMNFPQLMGKKPIRIAVIDSGIDTTHPLLSENVTQGRSYISEESATVDLFGHGTQVAGLLRTIAPQATLIPYKVLNSQGSGDSFNTITAIIDAVNDGANIINVSVGTYRSLENEEEALTKQAYERAIAYAKKNKTVVVASSGNNGDSLDDKAEAEALYHLPGGLEEVITVGSSTKDSTLAYYSNYGEQIDLVAPGGDFGPTYLTKGEMDVTYMLVTTKPMQQAQNFIDLAVGLPQGYTLSFGTSLSVPQVSAALALLMSRDNAKEPNPQKYINKLYRSATDLGKQGIDVQFGHGELNIEKLLE